MNKNEEQSNPAPFDEAATVSKTFESTSPSHFPAENVIQNKETPVKWSKSASKEGKTDLKKKCKIRFDMDLSENQIDNIFKGTVFSKAPMRTKLGMLRSIVQQIKFSDLRDLAFNTLSPGGNRVPDNSDFGNDQ